MPSNKTLALMLMHRIKTYRDVDPEDIQKEVITRLITFKEMSQWLGLSERELRYQQHHPYFPASYYDGKRKVYWLVEVAAWYIGEYYDRGTDAAIILAQALTRYRREQVRFDPEKMAAYLLDIHLERPLSVQQASIVIKEWSGVNLSISSIKWRANRPDHPGLEAHYYYGAASKMKRGTLRFNMPGVIRYALNLLQPYRQVNQGGRHE